MTCGHACRPVPFGEWGGSGQGSFATTGCGIPTHPQVRQGDLDACEQIMRAVCGQGLMQEYIHSLGYQARWSRIIPVDRSVFLGGRFYSRRWFVVG
jgi:hypothetical protein